MLMVSEPALGEKEKAAVIAVIDSNWITMGERVRAFELAFAEAHGVADAAAVSSCAAGLHLALEALGIGPGDEVLLPSLSFVATANCVLYVGATPVFVDIEGLDIPLMSLRDAAQKCTPRTKCVILMHYSGRVAEPAAWQEFAREHGSLLVEDSAHAVGIPEAGRIGHAAVFSFFGNKNMTTAEGGMVLARDPSVLERVKRLRAQGMTRTTHERHGSRSPGYDVTMLGWNYRMDEFRAAIGLAQLNALRSRNQRRVELARAYRDAIASYCPEVALPFEDQGPSAHHFLPAVLPRGVDRAAVMASLLSRDVQTTVHYSPIHQLSYYRDRFPNVCLPITEEFGRRELTLPLHPKLDDCDVISVVTALSGALHA